MLCIATGKVSIIYDINYILLWSMSITNLFHLFEQQPTIDKPIEKRKRVIYLRSVLTIFLVVWAIIFFIIKPWYLTGASFFGAALIVALQNFVLSFVAYIYINATSQFSEWDIIKTWNPYNPAIWEVRNIWPFFTSIREVDSEMLFTGRFISVPNNLIFNSGIFNYTRKDLLFWHDFTIVLSTSGHDAKEVFNSYRTIILKEYYKTLEDKTYNTSVARQSNPKFDLKITKEWFECRTKLLVHFYKLLDTNNTIMCALINEHKKGTIQIVKNSDSAWIEDSTTTVSWKDQYNSELLNTENKNIL